VTAQAAASTVATVGYGDGPASLPGRVVAVILMVIGISCFGLITATVTTLFLDRGRASVSNADLLKAIERLHIRLDRLKRKKPNSKE
jgi:voltage-gated potassium channel